MICCRCVVHQEPDSPPIHQQRQKQKIAYLESAVAKVDMFEVRLGGQDFSGENLGGARQHRVQQVKLLEVARLQFLGVLGVGATARQGLRPYIIGHAASGMGVSRGRGSRTSYTRALVGPSLHACISEP